MDVIAPRIQLSITNYLDSLASAQIELVPEITILTVSIVAIIITILHVIMIAAIAVQLDYLSEVII